MYFKNYFVFVLAIALLCSCRAMLLKQYGVSELKKFDLIRYTNFIYQLDTSGINIQHFYADTNSYKCIRKISQSKKTQKDLGQPIQLIYFVGDSLRSFHANCYAPGVKKNLNWNYLNRFETFPPRSAVQLDSMNFKLKSFSDCYVSGKIKEKTKFTVIIYWTLMLEKMSRTAIDVVFENIRKFKKQQNVIVYLINNDQSFLND